MNKIIAPAKAFVARHKTAIIVTTTATVTTAACIALNRGAITQHNDFLKEHDLFDAFYTFKD